MLSGSCTFGFIAPILAIITVQQKVLTGVLLILLFALGHCLPIMIAGSSTAAVRRLTESETWIGSGGWFRKSAGVVIGLLGDLFHRQSLFDRVNAMEASRNNHDHDHISGHNHSHEPPASLKNLIFAIVINGGIVAFEMVFGLMIQSMALISDAVHNLSDIAHMLFSYWAEKVARRPANDRKTYGYRKIEFIAAFVNSIGLSVVIAFVFWETLKRFTAPAEIPGQEMLWVAVVAFVGNGAATLLLQKISARNYQHEKRLAPFAPGRPVFPRGDRRRPADHVLRLASRRSPPLTGDLHCHRP